MIFLIAYQVAFVQWYKMLFRNPIAHEYLL